MQIQDELLLYGRTLLCQVGNMNQALFLPLAGVCNDLSGTAQKVKGIGDQMIAGIHHTLVGFENGEPFWNMFVLPRIVGCIEPRRRVHRPKRRMIRQYKGQRHLRVTLFCFFHSLSGQGVKASIAAYKEISDTLLPDMPLHGLGQQGQQLLSGIPVPNKKAGSVHVPSIQLPLPVL